MRVLPQTPVLTNSQGPSSSTLTEPSPIPGFETRPLFGSQPTLDIDEVCINAFQMMLYVAETLYSTPIPAWVAQSDYDDASEVRVVPWPHSSPQFQGKHVIQAIYDAGMAMAAKFVVKQHYVPSMYAGLFINNRQVGFLKFQLIQTAGTPNSTVSLINAVDSTSTLLLGHGDGLTGIQDEHGEITDKEDSNFTIKYNKLGQRIEYMEIFSLFLSAMATAARSDMTATDAYINSASRLGTAALNVHETNSGLSWSRLMRTLALIWEADYYTGDLDFEIFYNGSSIGEGFVMSMARSKTSMVSSG